MSKIRFIRVESAPEIDENSTLQISDYQEAEP